MSRWWGDRLRRRAQGDEGFGLVEIMIAMVIFGIVTVATAPLFLGGLKAGRASELYLQAKSLTQERLELIRNLPYYLGRDNTRPYLDVLDIYFRDLNAVGTISAGDLCQTRTYTAATSSYACRLAASQFAGDFSVFSQTVTSTFVNAERATVIPRAGYSSQVSGSDNPVSNLLQVVVTTTWTHANKTRTFTLRSYIANAQANPNLINGTVRASAVDINSNMSTGDVLQFEAGLISSEGALNIGSTASLSLSAARGGLASGTTIAGAALSLVAPPAVAGSSPTASGRYLDGSTCAVLCFGNTDIVGDQSLSVASGQPKVSLATNLATGILKRNGSGAVQGFGYTNATATQLDPALALDTTRAMVSGGGGPLGSEVLRGGGYLDATGSGSTAVRSSATVGLQQLTLFPSTVAPTAPGVVRIELTSATITCQSGGGSGAVSASWAGRVGYWSSVAGDYVYYDIGPGKPALPAPSTLTVAPGYPLSTWIDAWSGLSSTTSWVESAGRQGKGNIKPIISILTKPTRAADLTSPLNIAVGTLSCLAEDNR